MTPHPFTEIPKHTQEHCDKQKPLEHSGKMLLFLKFLSSPSTLIGFSATGDVLVYLLF